jgi:tetratricopeptide (TPR) repeat protein
MQELQTATTMVREGDFLPDMLGPLARDVARARARHGDASGAREMLGEMLKRYEQAPTAMVDIERADYLRALAEALQDLGDHKDAMHAWTLALEAGSVNPNARPRAEDLCLTMLSMVRSGAEPTEGMHARMTDIQGGLKAPW